MVLFDLTCLAGWLLRVPSFARSDIAVHVVGIDVQPTARRCWRQSGRRRRRSHSAGLRRRSRNGLSTFPAERQDIAYLPFKQ